MKFSGGNTAANKPGLNRRGIFEVEHDDTGVIQMVINSTTGNNGTFIESMYLMMILQLYLTLISVR